MDSDPELPPDDPELAALLRFEPVPRKQERATGWWSPENQRTFIRVRAETGSYRIAAEEVGLTANSAYQLRKEPGSDDFRRAWEEAVALHRRRSRAGPTERPGRARSGASARAANTPELEESEKEQLINEIMTRYLTKIQAERTARLEGRIVEADFYVRQLSWIELVLDIGGRTQEVLDGLRQDGVHPLGLVGTPGSALLERARRALWQEKGEADRPPPAPLGRHDDRSAMGEPTDYNAARDGDFGEWERRREEKKRLAAEAQAEWERRARDAPE